MNAFRKIAFALALVAGLLPARFAQSQILAGQNEPNPINLLENGNFNIAQRGTTAVSSITTVSKYLWDRWAAYSGTSTSAALTNITASLPSQFTAGAQLARTSGQTGVVLTCLVQEIPSSDITPLQGQPVALSFWALAGANFSAASSALTVKITTGTGSDEGLASLITGWTGAATTTLNTTQVITTAFQRFAFTGTIPATATEAAVQICFTPVGTAGTNDYFQVTGVQLQRGTVASNFEFRPLVSELARVQRYYWQIAETATITPRATCHVTTANSVMQCPIQFPVPMRIAPTATYTAGFAGFTTTAETTATNCSALAIDSTVVFVNSTTYALAACTLTSSTIAVGLSMTLVDNSGSGAMKFTADF